MIIFWTALAVLTVYRASRMIAMEDGPFEIFSRLQAWAGGNKNWIGRGLGCPMCLGFWIALVVVIIAIPLLGISDWRSFVLIWGAVSGGQAIIQRWVG